MTLPFELRRVQLGNTAFEGLNNCYVLGDPDGGATLIDTGLGHPETLAELREGLATHDIAFGDVTQILLTHWHGDHTGLAGTIQAEADCPVYIHEADAAIVAGDDDTQGPADNNLHACLDDWSMPSDKRAELLDFLAEHDDDDWPTPEVTPITGGARFDAGPVALDAIELPGHTAGLTGFAFDSPAGTELFSGDALLPYYTPNVGGADIRVEAPLTKYLDTLAAIVDGGYVRAWPGHRGAIIDPPGRAADIIDHHRERTERVIETLKDGPATPWDVSAALFGELRNIHILHGPGEAFAHLDHLHDAGVVQRTGRTYELVVPDADIDALFPTVTDRLPADYEPVH